MKLKNVIFIGWSAYGDQLSYNGMVRFLLNHFETVFLSCDSHLHFYVSTLYNDIMHRIILIDDGWVHRVVNENPGIYIINTKVNFQMENGTPKIWGSLGNFSDLVPIDKFIWDKNKISNVLSLDNFYTENNLEYTDNSSNFYVHVGLNPKIKTENFYYKRNLQLENNVLNEVLSKNNVQIGDEYIVICEFGSHIIKNEYKENKKIVNIDWCTHNPLHLGLIFENASEIHLVENSNSLFLYYCTVTNIIKSKNVNIHIYPRNRHEYYWKMMMNPQIKSWNFIF